MYLGRIVSIGRTRNGKNVAMYRVSSRSFPNRQTVKMGDKVAVMPRPGFEGDLQKNPYITYNCVRIAGNYAVVSNGSQTDPIAEKIASGMPVRDAMTLGLLALDYEHDSLDTPRIVGAVEMNGTRGFLGIIRKDAVLVRVRLSIFQPMKRTVPVTTIWMRLLMLHLLKQHVIMSFPAVFLPILKTRLPQHVLSVITAILISLSKLFERNKIHDL